MVRLYLDAAEKDVGCALGEERLAWCQLENLLGDARDVPTGPVSS